MRDRAQSDDDADSGRRTKKASSGDRAAWGAVLAQHRERLRRMVALRLDRRLQGRVDPSDVIQDAYLEAARRLPEYIQGAGSDAALPLAAVSHRPGPPVDAPAPPGRPGP